MPPALVPELICSDIRRSLAFYCHVLGFTERYARPREQFAYLERDGAELMLEQPLGPGRLLPRAELSYPYGRGINLEIATRDVDAVHRAVQEAGVAVFLALEERSYEGDGEPLRVRQFAVQDPDGYLLRFSQALGQSSG